MRAPHTEPDRDGDVIQGIGVAVHIWAAAGFSVWFFVKLVALVL